MAANGIQVLVRKATKEDMGCVRDMIQELADFEKMSNGPTLSTADLTRDAGLDGGIESMHCYVAECSNDESLFLSRNLMGYAICFFTYSTWQGKSYFLEDIFVRPSYRKHGIGRQLFKHVARMAQEYRCPRLDFHVLDWNPARTFYEKFGAVNLTNKEGWQFYRIDTEQMKQLLDENI